MREWGNMALVSAWTTGGGAHDVHHDIDELDALRGSRALPACGLRNALQRSWRCAQARGCVRRGVQRERAAVRGGGRLARGEGTHRVRPCPCSVTCVAGIFPTFNLSCYITVQVMAHAFR